MFTTWTLKACFHYTWNIPRNYKFFLVNQANFHKTKYSTRWHENEVSFLLVHTITKKSWILFYFLPSISCESKSRYLEIYRGIYRLIETSHSTFFVFARTRTKETRFNVIVWNILRLIESSHSTFFVIARTRTKETRFNVIVWNILRLIESSHSTFFVISRTVTNGTRFNVIVWNIFRFWKPVKNSMNFLLLVLSICLY